MSYANIDFHCHSNCSDGALSPAKVVQRAAANGATALALTDHDTLLGQRQARDTAQLLGLRYVTGVEISTQFLGISIHIVGLGIDIENVALNTQLKNLAKQRKARALQMARSLEKVGIEGSFSGAMALAQNPELVSRTHFARYLVQSGACASVSEVFANYLTEGKPGYAPAQWVTVGEAVSWILAAGGVAVLAHPGRYRLSAEQLRELVALFKTAGGRAIEVISGSQRASDTPRIIELAEQFDLAASQGSDFHSEGESRFDVGKAPPLPLDCKLKRVWALL